MTIGIPLYLIVYGIVKVARSFLVWSETKKQICRVEYTHLPN